MKLLIAVLVLLPSFTFAGSFKLPKGYKAVLDCPANKKSPSLMVASKGKTLYLAAKVDGVVRLFELSIDDGDCGYSTMAPDNRGSLGALSKYVNYVYIYNNDEEIEDANDAVVTGGQITSGPNRTEQDCIVVSKNIRVNDIF